jgi:hypothetical protein
MSHFKSCFCCTSVALFALLAASQLQSATCPVPTANPYPWPVWSPTIPAVAPSSTGRTLYVDGTAGLDTNSGLTIQAAFKTIGRAMTGLQAGDTILIRRGLYREPINFLAKNVPSGTALKPITVGSYGDGEVIVDGSPKVTGWRQKAGTVWEVTIGFQPAGLVVNEVPLRQVPQGANAPGAPAVDANGIVGGGGKWHFAGSTAGGTITADMGGAIGNGDANAADIVVPRFSADQEHVYFYQHRYITLKGLTIRGSGSNGVWGYGNNITIESCNIKFNGKAAVSFLPFADTFTNEDNVVLTSHVYHNVLQNWPRGNNGYAVSGGGWPGALAWSGALRPVARGNLVYMNGGEGIISYGNIAGKQTGAALFEQNVAYDNWSVNMYIDNQIDGIARNNFLYNHPINNDNFIYSAPANVEFYGNLGKYSTCLMLADEYNSGDDSTGRAALANTQVYNNVIANCRIGIRDYSEGTPTIQNHGLKNTLIANNTIIMPNVDIPGTSVFGMFLQDNGNKDVGTVIQNNVIVGSTGAPVMFAQKTGPLTGITMNNNVYFSSAAKPFGAGYSVVTYFDFAGWKINAAGADTNSKFIDPQLTDVTGFRAIGSAPYDPNNADLRAQFNTNFALRPRGTWNAGAH